MSELKSPIKSHDIPKLLVWGAWLKVKENGGAAGADGVSISAVRGGPEGQPLQAVEPHVVGQLFSRAGSRGGNTEEGRHKGPRHSERGRQGGANGGGHGVGA